MKPSVFAALLLFSQPAGDGVPILRIIALAEDQQRLTRDFGGGHACAPRQRVLTVYRELPGDLHKRRPFQPVTVTFMSDGERDIERIAFEPDF